MHGSGVIEACVKCGNTEMRTCWPPSGVHSNSNEQQSTQCPCCTARLCGARNDDGELEGLDVLTADDQEQAGVPDAKHVCCCR